MLLTVLTYGYATCRFSSEELAEALRKDPALRYLSSRIFPEPSVFIKFRRVNAHAIIYSINLLIKKVKELCANGKTADAAMAVDKRPGYLMSDLNKDINCELPVDAERRLGIAVMRDCFEMDF